MRRVSMGWARSLGLFFGVLTGCGSGQGNVEDVASGGTGPDSGGVSEVGGTGSGSAATGGADSGLGGAGASPASGGDAAGGSDSDAGGGSGGRSDRQACKRGVAYGHHSPADLQVLSTGISWWYNWDFRPDTSLAGADDQGEGLQYVPMIWGGGSDPEAAGQQIPEDARVLLGFNEPNFGSQANLSAADAAGLWPHLEALADARDLRLVSPAVNYCGGDCQDTDPFHYLEDFFAECVSCRVDAIAFHVYVGCNPPGDNQAEWLINQVETYKSRFEGPLWLTEFACDDAGSVADEKAFLQDAVAYLEAEPRIERYAWFSGRADNVPFVDLLGEDGTLTELGVAYVTAPQDPACERSPGGVP